MTTSEGDLSAEHDVDGEFPAFSPSDIRRTTTIVLVLVAVMTTIGVGLIAWWSRVQTENACMDLAVIDQMAPDRPLEGAERKRVEACRALKIDF